MADALDFEKAARETPAIEETMLLDTIRAMRRDRKEHAKYKRAAKNDEDNN